MQSDPATADAFRDRFGGERLTYTPVRQRAPDRKLTYEPRIFDRRVMMPDEIERIHDKVLEFEMIEEVSEPMRQLIEELWAELVPKLPPKRT
jgi:hypothetical protein